MTVILTSGVSAYFHAFSLEHGGVDQQQYEENEKDDNKEDNLTQQKISNYKENITSVEANEVIDAEPKDMAEVVMYQGFVLC